MQYGSRIVGQFQTIAALTASILLVGALSVGGDGAALAETAVPQSAKVNVNVTVTDLRSSNGVLRACMTADPDKFPQCRGDASAYSVVVPASGSVELAFKGVKPGRYAIALLHDENNNNKADRALMMMPTEGFGFSRDAKVRMGPPKFEAAAFAVGDASVRQTIRMRYML